MYDIDITEVDKKQIKSDEAYTRYINSGEVIHTSFDINAALALKGIYPWTDSAFIPGTAKPYITLVTLSSGRTITCMYNVTKTSDGSYVIEPTGYTTVETPKSTVTQMLLKMNMGPKDEPTAREAFDNLVNEVEEFLQNSETDWTIEYILFYFDDNYRYLYDEGVYKRVYNYLFHKYGNMRDPGFDLIPAPTEQYVTITQIPFNASNVAQMILKTIPIAKSIAETAYPSASFALDEDKYNAAYIENVVSDAIAYAPELFNGYRSYFTIHLALSYDRPSIVQHPKYRWGNAIILDLYDVDLFKFEYYQDLGSVYAYLTSPGKRIIIYDRTDPSTKEHIGSVAYGFDVAGDRTQYDKFVGYWGLRYNIGHIQVATYDGQRTTYDTNCIGFSGSYKSGIKPDWVLSDLPPTGRGYEIDFPDTPKTDLIPEDEPVPQVPEIIINTKVPNNPIPPSRTPDNDDIKPPRDDEGETSPIKPSFTELGMFFTVYNPTQDELKTMSKKLFNPTAIDVIKEIFTDTPMDAIISLHGIYVTPQEEIHYSEFQNIYLGTIDCGDDSSCPVITNNIYIMSCGYADIDRFFNDYRDFSPYTTIHLYLPFIGYIDLPADTFMGGKLGVQYNIDLITGDCVAFVIANRNNVEQCVSTHTGNCSFQIPLAARDRTQLVRSGITGIASTVLSAGNPAAFANAAVNITTAGQPIQHTGSLTGNHGALSYKKPFVIIERCQKADVSTHKDILGNPTNITGTLSSFNGLTRVKDCHVDTLSCTKEEQQMIYEQLINGILI